MFPLRFLKVRGNLGEVCECVCLLGVNVLDTHRHLYKSPTTIKRMLETSNKTTMYLLIPPHNNHDGISAFSPWVFIRPLLLLHHFP